jgi:hypothetical protein
LEKAYGLAGEIVRVLVPHAHTDSSRARKLEGSLVAFESVRTIGPTSMHPHRALASAVLERFPIVRSVRLQADHAL